MHSGGECMGVYPARSMERAMKFQEVILRAMSKQITWMQAAEILGMSDRNMRRYRNRLDKGGYDGLMDRRTERPRPKRGAMGDGRGGVGVERGGGVRCTAIGPVTSFSLLREPPSLTVRYLRKWGARSSNWTSS